MDLSGETEEKQALGLLLSNTKSQILLIALFTALLIWPHHSIFICRGGYLSNRKITAALGTFFLHIYTINIYICIKNEISKSRKTCRNNF